MDNIWDGNPSKSEVIGRCGGDEKNRMPTQNRQSRTQTNTRTPIAMYIVFLYAITVEFKFEINSTSVFFPN